MDTFDKAVQEEDRGDRWLSSGDIRKATRFYARSIDLYQQAMQNNVGSTIDCIYNIVRIKSLVWTKAIKTGELLGTPEQNDSKWPTSAQYLVNMYEEALALIGDKEQARDLIYNYAQALREAGEEEQDGTQWFQRAMQILEQALVTSDGEGACDHQTHDHAQAPEQEEGFKGTSIDDQAQLLVLYIECACQTLENLDVVPGDDAYESVRAKADAALGSLNHMVALHGPQLEEKTVQEVGICLAQYQSVLASSVEEIDSIWADESLLQMVSDIEPAKQFARAESYLDYFHNKEEFKNDGQLGWQIYTKAGQTLASAQTQCASKMTAYDKIKMYIARGDIEWLRSKLQTESAVANQARLLANASQLYANALNVSALAPNAETQQAQREAKVKQYVLSLGSSAIDIDDVVRVAGPQATIILRDMSSQGLI